MTISRRVHKDFICQLKKFVNDTIRIILLKLSGMSYLNENWSTCLCMEYYGFLAHFKTFSTYLHSR